MDRGAWRATVGSLAHQWLTRLPSPTRLLCPWNFPGKNTRVGCHFLLQGIFQTQQSDLGLLHGRRILYQIGYLPIQNRKFKKGNIFDGFSSETDGYSSLLHPLPHCLSWSRSTDIICIQPVLRAGEAG